MAYDVFISYSHVDKLAADAACATLEAAGIRCWIAPRDIAPGAEWGEAIVEAIDHCSVMVLIFSSNANELRQVRREVERAVNAGDTIMPVRIEPAEPTRSLAYFMAGLHWLDALNPPLEQHFQRLAISIRALLQTTSNEADVKAADEEPAEEPRPQQRRKRQEEKHPQARSREHRSFAIALIGAAALGGVVLALIWGGVFTTPTNQQTATTSSRDAPALPMPQPLTSVQPAAPPSAPGEAARPPTDAELKFWETVASSTDASDFQEYLRQYPQGRFVGLAHDRIAALRPPQLAPGPARQEGEVAPAPQPQASTYDGHETARVLQSELQRVGCYVGNVDGNWDHRSMDALRRFNQRARASLIVDTPSADAIAALRRETGRVCPIVCPRGQTAAGDHCVAVSGRPAAVAARPIAPSSPEASASTPSAPSSQGKRCTTSLGVEWCD